MANIDDPGDLRNRLKREIERLERAVADNQHPLTAEDERKIEDFLTHHRANNDNKPQSNYLHLQRLRLSAERAGTSLMSMNSKDIDNLVTALLDEYGCKKTYVDKYKNTWRVFFRFVGRDWADDIGLFGADSKKVDKDMIFSEKEVKDMLEIADARDGAAIAVMADTGCRIGALCSLYNRSFDNDGDISVINLNDKAPTKGAEGNVPLTWSVEYLINYKQTDHPRPSRDDVALIHQKRGHYDLGKSGALRTGSLRDPINRVMLEAGIEQSHRRKSKHFRHTAVTRWLRSGVSKEVIRHRMKWEDMSMLDNYSHLVEKDKDQMTAEEFGIVDSEETDGRSDPEELVDTCPVCDSAIRPDVRFCPGCGNPVSVEAAHNVPPEEVQQPKETSQELVDAAETRGNLDKASLVEQLLTIEPDLTEKIDWDRVYDESSSR